MEFHHLTGPILFHGHGSGILDWRCPFGTALSAYPATAPKGPSAYDSALPLNGISPSRGQYNPPPMGMQGGPYYSKGPGGGRRGE